jgi:hypothetical protein
MKTLQQTQQKDLLGDLSDLDRFVLIYCQGMLHHTVNRRQAFLNLCQEPETIREIVIDVPRKKALLQKYASDCIRSQISELSCEQALKAMGKVLMESIFPLSLLRLWEAHTSWIYY